MIVELKNLDIVMRLIGNLCKFLPPLIRESNADESQPENDLFDGNNPSAAELVDEELAFNVHC